MTETEDWRSGNSSKLFEPKRHFGGNPVQHPGLS